MARRCSTGKAKAKAVEFKLDASGVNQVTLAGDFNNWDSNSFPLKKDKKGVWKKEVNLKPGRYEYKFLVDGQWQNDPHCTSCIPNAFGSQNCVVVVK